MKKVGLVLVLALLQSGCGSDSELGSGTGSSDVESEESIRLGSGNGDGFSAGVLDVAVPSLSAGGVTTVTATLVDSNGSLYTEGADVRFSSVCTGQGSAELVSPVTATDGFAISTYSAQGCEGTDTITASATVNGQNLSAIGNVTVLAADAGSLRFVSADPASIGIRGAGLEESAMVTFEVLDTKGDPIAGEAVDFALNTTRGGITIDPLSDTSDANGMVRTVVASGTVSTSVRVTASLQEDPLVASQSDGLVISTGIADQDSFSLSASVLNPEAWDYDGETVDINIYAADHFNNPVPDGTTVYFTTEGGQIEPQCIITNGGCSITWTSSAPRPSDGRATILASMIGEETFVDLDGNGILDDGDTFVDMPEAFRDDNENGARDAASEEFRDFNSNQAYDSGDGKYNGVLCNAENSTNVCSDVRNIDVRDELVLVMSGSAASVGFASDPCNASSGMASCAVTIGDSNGQPLPAGTTVEISTDNGKLNSKESYEVLSTNFNGSLTFPIIVSSDGTSDSGVLTVTVTTPKGVLSTGYLTVVD